MSVDTKSQRFRGSDWVEGALGEKGMILVIVCRI